MKIIALYVVSFLLVNSNFTGQAYVVLEIAVKGQHTLG